MSRDVLAVALVAMLGACSYATVVHREQYSGVIELNGDLDDAMKKAKGEMASHCGADNYTVVSEGYEQVAARTNTSRGEAWRVHYQCNNAPQQYPGPQQPYPQQPPYQDPQQPYPQQPPYQDPQQPYPQQPYPQQPQQYPDTYPQP